MTGHLGAVAFDLDGVLIDGPGSWQVIHEALGTVDASRANLDAFFAGAISYTEWATRDVGLWKGVPKKKLEDIAEHQPLMAGAQQVVADLQNRKILPIIISGGVDIIAYSAAHRLGISEVYVNTLTYSDDCVDGVGEVVGFSDKGLILRTAATHYDIPLERWCAVGDWENDIPLFKEAGFAIAYNPKNKKTSEAADVVVDGDFLQVGEQILSWFNQFRDDGDR